MTAVEGRLGERVAGPPRETRRASVVERAGALPALILFALALRLPLWLAAHPLHHDEALYGSWARLIASGQDPLLLTAWVDKPPLVLYLLAAAIGLLGSSELALRLPGMVAGVLAIPLLYGFARRAYDAPTARLAAALLAGSAFAVQFAPTAFTDPWLSLWLIAGAWAALAGRGFWAGVAVGLAVASKQQGLLGVPLILALLALHQQRRDGRLRLGSFVADALLPGLFGFGLIFFSVTWWDSLRWAKRPSFWDRSLVTYGGLRLAVASDLPRRALAWLRPLGYLFGPPVVTATVLALAAAPAARALRRRTRPDAAATLDLLLTVAAAVFLILHIAVTFQPWDRYLLPLIPLCALLAARGLVMLARLGAGASQPPLPAAAGVALALMLASSAALGAMGRLPVGSDHGAYAGVRELAVELRALPDDSALYYHSLGWHYDYYLFDAPQERRWWDSAWKLAGDAAATTDEEPSRQQWIVLPGADGHELDNLRLALAARGLTLAGSRRAAPVGAGPETRLYLIGPRAP